MGVGEVEDPQVNMLEQVHVTKHGDLSPLPRGQTDIHD